MSKATGRILPLRTMVLREHVGTASSETDGKQFNFKMASTMSREPHITCVETGKQFILPWQDILDLAEAAGITGADAENQ